MIDTETGGFRYATDGPDAAGNGETRKPDSGRGGMRQAPIGGSPSYAAALVAVAPAIPIIATVSTTLIYAARPTSPLMTALQEVPLLAGTLFGVALGLGFALIYRFLFTAAGQANAGSYGMLSQRVEQVQARLRVLWSMQDASAALSVSQRIALSEADAHYQSIERNLRQSSIQWVTGEGYLNAWALLHRAEEALIEAEPVESVLSGALYDELRLEDSTIERRDRLLSKLRRAVVALSPSAAAYLHQQPPALRPNPPAAQPGTVVSIAATAGSENGGGPSAASAEVPPGGSDHSAAPPSAVASVPTSVDLRRGDSGLGPGPTDSGPTPHLTDVPLASGQEARAILREVRRTLNEFRDERWAGLLRLRNRLLATLTLTGLVTYVLLGFAMNGRPSNAPADPLQDPILAAAAFYLVGAIVGLFNRMYGESSEDAAIEDYGLSRARLLLTPILSGLAAVGGVLITAMLIGSINGAVLTPGAEGSPPVTTPAETSAGDSAPLSLPHPQDVFNLQQYPFGLVIAAIFGLTPGLLISRLKKESDSYKVDLQMSEGNSRELPPAGAARPGLGGA